MRSLVALLVLASTSAYAETPTTLRTSLGLDVGDHTRSDDGAKLGADLDAELRIGHFILGGTAGFTDYAPFGDVPLHASTFAGRAGINMPLRKPASNDPAHAGRRVQVDAIGAAEFGVHRYSVNGKQTEFLGPTETFVSDQQSIGFVGARLGLVTTIRHHGWKNGLMLRLELIGRRDLATANIEYRETSCGGLFSSPTDCSSTQGMTGVGGTEVGVRFSFGVAFGG